MMLNLTGRRFGVYLEVLLHVIFWTIMLAGFIATENNVWKSYFMKTYTLAFDSDRFYAWKQQQGREMFFVYDLSMLIFKVVLFYVNVYFILPLLLVRRWKAALGMLFANLLFCLLAEFAGFALVQSIYNDSVVGIMDYYDNDEPLVLLERFVWVLGFSIVYFGIRYAVLMRRGRLTKVAAELALLRNQVNPHFLFNTLNNFYAMAMEKDAPELAEGISQLTHLMRYNIYESRTPYISLGKEIAYIQDYIRLQSLRFRPEDDIDIVFDDAGTNPQLQIAPMLFIGFVENAFKHGISLKTHSFIRIRLSTSQKDVHFEIENSIHRRTDAVDVKYAGFGLEHTSRLLSLQYGKRYTLDVKEENDIFKVVLSISTK